MSTTGKLKHQPGGQRGAGQRGAASVAMRGGSSATHRRIGLTSSGEGRGKRVWRRAPQLRTRAPCPTCLAVHVGQGLLPRWGDRPGPAGSLFIEAAYRWCIPPGGPLVGLEQSKPYPVDGGPPPLPTAAKTGGFQAQGWLLLWFDLGGRRKSAYRAIRS